MFKSGMIRRFVPLFDPSSSGRGLVALVTLKVASSVTESVVKRLLALPEVEGLYATTGESNFTLKLSLPGVQALQPFIREHVLEGGVEVTGSQVVTETLKDEPPSLSASSISMKLTCEYCGGEVLSSRPYNMAAGNLHYYFCCRTCRKAYLTEHGPRLSKLGLVSAQD